MSNNNKSVTQLGLLNIETLELPKSRALKALDDIVGNVLDIAAAYTERPSKKIRAETERQISTDNTIHKRTLTLIGHDPAFVKQAMNKESLRILKSHRNREAIVETAIQYLSAAKPEDFEAETEEVSPDWIDQFADYAGKCSDENMQQLFAKILSGEIQQPGRYSKSTIRVVAELSKTEAELISKHNRKVLAGTIIDNTIDNEKNYKLEYMELEYCGIIADATSQTGKPVPLKKQDDGHMQTLIPLPDNNFLLLTFKKPLVKSQRIRYRKEQDEYDLVLPCIKLTRQGRELIQILPKPNSEELAAHIVHFVEKELSDWKVIKGMV